MFVCSEAHSLLLVVSLVDMQSPHHPELKSPMSMVNLVDMCPHDPEVNLLLSMVDPVDMCPHDLELKQTHCCPS